MPASFNSKIGREAVAAAPSPQGSRVNCIHGRFSLLGHGCVFLPAMKQTGLEVEVSSGLCFPAVLNLLTTNDFRNLLLTMNQSLKNSPKILKNHPQIKFSISLRVMMLAAGLFGPNLVHL